MAANVEATLQLLDQVEVPENRAARLRLRDAALRLAARLHTPIEHIRDICNTNQSLYAVLHATIDMGLWTAWTADGGEVRRLEELAELVPGGCDLDVLRRLLRLLVTQNVVQEMDEDSYRRTELTEALGDPESTPSKFVKWNELASPSIRGLPAFLASTSYKNAGTKEHNPHTTTDPDGLDMFSRTRADPEFNRIFSSFMRALTATKVPWTEVFDTTTLLDGAEIHSDGAAPLLVDIAGGLGTDVRLFLARHADADIPKGAIVLQDQPVVLASQGMDALDPDAARARVRTMAHDFFTPQPLVGARAYFFHAVLHDWVDQEALCILKHTAAAMKKGYSKLLLYEVCLPPLGASVWQTAIDIRMMQIGGRERTERMWRELLGAAGLVVVKIWSGEGAWESVIEAELA